MDEHKRRSHVTEEDRRRMRRLGQDLKEIETDEPVEGEALVRLITWANDRREARGIPPLETDDDEYPPEQELYRRARSLGMGEGGG